MQFLKYLSEPFLRPLRSKTIQCWILRLQLWNFTIISESLAANLEKVRQMSVWQTVPKFWFIWLWYLSFCITYVSLCGTTKKQKIQNFGTVCHTEVCITFLRLAAELSELAKKIMKLQPQVQPRTSFDPNGLKNSPFKHFESSLKSMHLSQKFMRGMSRGRDRTKSKWPKQWGVIAWLKELEKKCFANVWWIKTQEKLESVLP